MKLLTKLSIACILCTMLVCGGVSADSSSDSFCVELDNGIGYNQHLYLNGVCITDCDGNQFALNDPRGYLDTLQEYRPAVINLPGSGLNCDKPFKEVKLHLTLERDWGFSSCYKRWDKFTLNVTDLATKTENKPNTILLKVSYSYQVGKADAVTFYDCNKNKLKHFSSTHDDGKYGSWDYSSVDRLSLHDWFCVEFAGDIGIFQCLCLNGVYITDCDGNQFASNQFSWHTSNFAEEPNGKYLDDKVFSEIYILGSGLNCNIPFKEVKLHLTLYRDWGYKRSSERQDKFTLDVTDLVTKTEDKPYTVLLKGSYSYQVGKADAVTIYDCNKNKLKHFPSTHDKGRYCSWDYLDWFYIKMDGDIGYNQDLYLNGVYITDCDGNQFVLNKPKTYDPIAKVHSNELAEIDLDISCSGLNCDKPFKEVKLHLILRREWGFESSRWDKFTLYLTNLVTKTENKPYTILLKAYNSYQVGKADAVTIYDGNKNELIHFSPTHDDGEHGSWD